MKRLLLGIVAVALTGCGPAVTTTATGQGPTQTTQTEASGSQGPYSQPVRSRIPHHFRLWKFSATVVPVRVKDGTLIPPDDPHVIGWWGRRPGAPHGTTLLVGHSVHTGGGELDSLSHTPVGALLTVGGLRYRVTSVRIMSKARVARRAASLFRQDGPPRIMVVSCASYNWSTHEWPANAIVIARRAS
jgi:hypothetical protein